MKRASLAGIGFLTLGIALGTAPRAHAQGPTIPDAPTDRNPGSGSSLLGASPGSGGGSFNNLPGSGGGTLGGRPGVSVGRSGPALLQSNGPTLTPAGNPRPQLSTTPPPPIPVYGTVSLPDGPEDEGPPEGLTLDMAIERLVAENLTLRAQGLEIPQAQADILTAGLRANPLLYADSQLIPYGQYSRQRPGGPLQYDVNITYPIDVTLKRLARREVAVQAKRVLEAQYQDAVRTQIDVLYSAYVEALAAREAVRLARTSLEGWEQVLAVSEPKFKAGTITQAELNRLKIPRNTAELGLYNEEQRLKKALRSLATLLNLSTQQGDRILLRGTIRDRAPEPAPLDQLLTMALTGRPDLVSYRLGLSRANADVKLANANRYSDVYLLVQPYTFQNNAPYGTSSATSWAVGATVPLPIFNRNQGNIQRARLNLIQTEVELRDLERRVANDVTQAAAEYEISRRFVERIQHRDRAGGQAGPPDRQEHLQGGGLGAGPGPGGPARVQRGHPAVSRRRGPPPPEHARPEHGGRPADLALSGSVITSRPWSGPAQMGRSRAGRRERRGQRTEDRDRIKSGKHTLSSVLCPLSSLS